MLLSEMAEDELNIYGRGSDSISRFLELSERDNQGKLKGLVLWIRC
jgi:hypothetical protein